MIGAGLDKKKCEPFVSQYTDCTDENMCSGCSKCTCSAAGQWQCDRIRVCDDEVEETAGAINDATLDFAMRIMQNDIQKKRPSPMPSGDHSLVPSPSQKKKKQESGTLLGVLENEDSDIEDELFFDGALRRKRSLNKDNDMVKENSTVKFYGVVDELNEDIFNNSNSSGVIQAKKIGAVKSAPVSSRRKHGIVDGKNISLQIEYNQPNMLQHITDNKIDTVTHDENKLTTSHVDKHNIFGNYTQESKGNELSKLVVNELQKHSEIIGDIKAPVISNITFTPENGTLVTMAFIAGNLLSRLWNMEKDISGTSMQAEVLRHDKIVDLLDLFKNPLTLSQEGFLKNALLQLSIAIDNNVDLKNFSVCDSIEQARKFLELNANADVNETSNPNNTVNKKCKKTNKTFAAKNENAAITETLNKISNVIALTSKLDGIQKNIDELKKSDSGSTNTTQDQKSLNKFGKLLKQITKLLLPNRHNKEIGYQIQNQNILVENKNIRNKIKEIYNLDLSNLTLTSKDKIVFDYLTHIEENPDCILKNKKNHKPSLKSLPDIEGNILLNLSEFFKLKSFADLVKLLEPTTQSNLHHTILTTTTNKPIETTTLHVKREGEYKDPKKLENTKEKLKAHLKIILEDLLEIQSAKGINKSDINIVDALPCIYNILNTHKDPSRKLTRTRVSNRVASIFNDLKNELQSAQSRRSSINIDIPPPKSAIIWERVIRNLNKISKDVFMRRSMEAKIPKSFQEIKKMMNKIESYSSNTYKSHAILNEVPVAERTVLMKALGAEIGNYVKILENIKLSWNTFNNLPSNQKLDLIEFVKNAATNINLNYNVINNIDKPKAMRHFVDTTKANKGIAKPNNIKNQALRHLEVREGNDNTRISRDMITNQLIKNRIVLYLKSKEAKGLDANDINYKIGQHILMYLESGNYEMARELYKVFLQDGQNSIKSFQHEGYNAVPNQQQTIASMSILQKQPLIQFEEQNAAVDGMKWLNQQPKAQLDETKWLNQQSKPLPDETNWANRQLKPFLHETERLPEPKSFVNEMKWLSQQPKALVDETMWLNQQPKVLVDDMKWLSQQPKAPMDQMKWSNQDHLIQQLLNVKTMNI